MPNAIALLCSVSILVLAGSAFSQGQGCAVREVKFSEGVSSAIIKRQLEPCTNQIYRFRARAGQRAKVGLSPETNDVVFYLQGTNFLPAPTYSYVLEGIYTNGADEWEGILPNDDVYEIWIRRPAVSNSRQKRTKPYVLRIEIR